MLDRLAATLIVSRTQRTQDATQWGSAIERPLLSPYDIINPMQMVSFLWGGDVTLWGGDVTSHILIMLDSSSESTPHSTHLRIGTVIVA